jgi:hypothetical protein
MVLGDEDRATILEQKRSLSLAANTIRGHRADHTSKGAGKSYQYDPQQGVDPASALPGDEHDTGQRHHHFAR